MQERRTVDFVYYVIPFVLASLKKICLPHLFLELLRVECKTSCMKNSYKICIDVFLVTLLLNQKKVYKKDLI